MNTLTSDQAQVFAALGDGIRLELVARLSRNEGRSISQLTKGLQVSRQAVTKHLRVLEDAKVVTSRKAGRENHFAIQKQTLDNAQEYLAQASVQWDEFIGRLKATVENEA